MGGNQYDLSNQTDIDLEDTPSVRGSYWSHVWAWRRFIILVVAPLLFAPLPAVIGTSEARCAYVVMLMAAYWFTEAMPVGVTALIPAVLFPLLGILDTKSTTMLYMKDTNMLFVGGLLVAIAIEYWNLHRRIALRILMVVGAEPRWLMLGMMGATWFLSMWISNTATTAMMVPITEAVLKQLEGTRSKTSSTKQEEHNGINDGKEEYSNHNSETANGGAMELSVVTSSDGHTNIEIISNGGGEAKANGYNKGKDQQDSHQDSGSNAQTNREFTQLCKGMSLCICYSASCGGIASLTGTGPNLILKENSDSLYEKSSISNPVNFGSWMAFGLPMSITVLLVCWLWLQLAFLGRHGLLCCYRDKSQDKEASRRVKEMIREEYRKLGPIVFGQGMVLALFVLLVTLWVTRDMGGTVGWGSLFELKVKDSVPAVLVGILLFIMPSTIPCMKSYHNYSHPQKDEMGAQPSSKIVIRPLLNWPTVHKKMPWQLILLLGGGFALSGGFNESGLSDWIGDQLEFLSSLNEWVVLIIISYIAAACTEVTSNVAMSSVLLPIMQRLATKLGAHPLSYVIPVCLSTSFAFMLPVATPPNAIVFTYGRVRIADMAKAGIVMNILAVPIVVIMTQTIGKAVFGFDENPADFLRNATELIQNGV